MASVPRREVFVARATHPPAPSQGEGEPLLENGMLRKNRNPPTFPFETRNMCAKDIPLSSGEGLGVRPVCQKQPSNLATPTPRKSSVIPVLSN
jgi:hypothetical protein